MAFRVKSEAPGPKGVIVCQTPEQVFDAVAILLGGKLGKVTRIVIEEVADDD